MILGGFDKAALVVLDGDGRVRQWSEDAAALTGAGRGAALNAVLADLIPSATEADDPLRELARCTRSGPCSDSRMRTGAHGKQLAVALEICAFGGDDGGGGDAPRFAVMLQHADQAHDRILRERLQDLAEQTALIGHWRLDVATHRMHWSDGVFRIHGLPIGSGVVFEKALAFLVPEDRARVEEALDDAIRNKRDYAFRATIRRPDGVFRTVDVKGRPELGEHGEAVALFGVIRDVTAETEASRSLIKARDDATAAAEAHMMLLATMSHEIRTPLTGIIGMLEMLREEADSERRQRALASVEGASRTLLTVLNDVLDHTKIESGELTLEHIPFDLAEVAASAADLFHPSADEKRLALECQVAGGMPVLGDPVRVQQILSNFLSNAIKFTQAGRVQVDIRDEGAAGFLIQVTDTGTGIAREKLKELFTPFRQADASITREFGGSGLGLAICKRLAEAMGGTIGADSQPGAGSTFWVRLPLERTAPGRKPPEAAAEAQTGLASAGLALAGGETPAVLVADDVETNRLVAEAHLQALGVEVCTVANGFEGVQRFCEGGIDAILMDGSMPLLNGIEAAELIRMLPPPWCGVPIIGCTAYSLSQSHENMEAAGMDTVIEKPFGRAAALAALAPLLEGRAKLPPMRAVTGDAALDRQVAQAARAFREGQDDLAREALARLCEAAAQEPDEGLARCCRFALRLADKLDAGNGAWLADFLLGLSGQEHGVS
ncbi:ATP-binding protein [Novosphingobium beihaiensis]|uniref:histidine kinase n=1 Tax=Novosphingobium beihaiensis TaxID=2930389 RepID=A0ABT0BUX7_9SPHN|nr:ATP-binding protein [Novosphingobium beihaiensis]MCJ2188859.1 ATP-binding protein [Novosphingobium beihaiensis]